MAPSPLLRLACGAALAGAAHATVLSSPIATAATITPAGAGPIHRWFSYTAANPCPTTSSPTMTDTGSSATKINLTYVGTPTCDATNQAMTSTVAWTGTGALADNSQYMSVVIIGQMAASTSGPAMLQFTPSSSPISFFTMVPASVTTVAAGAMGVGLPAGSGGSVLDVKYPWISNPIAHQVFTSTISTTANYMYVVTIGPNGAIAYMNGFTLLKTNNVDSPLNLRSYSGLNRYGVKQIFPSGSGTLLIKSVAGFGLQEVQVYNYELSKAQVKALVAATSAIAVPAPPPVSQQTRALDFTNYTALTSLMTHRYLGPNQYPFADGTVKDWVGTNDAVISGFISTTALPNIASNILAAVTVVSAGNTNAAWGCLEMGQFNFSQSQNSFTIRVLFSSDVNTNKYGFQMLYHNYFIQYQGGSDVAAVQGTAKNLGQLTVSNLATGVQITKSLSPGIVQGGISADSLLSNGNAVPTSAAGSPQTMTAGYLTVSAGSSGFYIYIGESLVIFLPTVLPYTYASSHSLSGAFCYGQPTSGLSITSLQGPADIQVYDVALTPATIIALAQGMTLTGQL